MEYNLEVLRRIANCDYVRPNVIGPSSHATASIVVFNAVWVDNNGQDNRVDEISIVQEEYNEELAIWIMENN